MRTTKVAFSTVFLSLLERLCWLGYKTLNFIFLSFFLSSFFWEKQSHVVLKTHRIIYSYEKKRV